MAITRKRRDANDDTRRAATTRAPAASTWMVRLLGAAICMAASAAAAVTNRVIQSPRIHAPSFPEPGGRGSRGGRDSSAREALVAMSSVHLLEALAHEEGQVVPAVAPAAKLDLADARAVRDRHLAEAHVGPP